MFIVKGRGKGGRAVLALAAIALTCSVAARADTPEPQAIGDAILEAEPKAFDPSLQIQRLPDVQAEPTIVEPQTVEPQTVEPGYEHIGDGEASYYGFELAGNRTASGERFNPHGMTAAHRTLPLGSRLRVTNKANGKSVIVRVNDRGPFVGRRIIDVSLGAAREVAMVRSGKAMVKLELLR